MGSKLRTNFENHLSLNRLAPKTKEAYIRSVAAISKFYKQPPDTLTNEQIQRYLVHMIEERKLSWSSCNVAFSAFYCFYAKFLKWPKTQFCIPARPRSRKLPEILSQKQVQVLFGACKNRRDRALLMLVYGSGLRVSEAVCLKPHHIETDRMLVRVEQSKGRKDRYTLLSKTALEALREYWVQYRPEQYLFFGHHKQYPMSISAAQRIYYRTKKAAGIKVGKGIHTLRHCFATHLLEHGIDIYLIKRFLGHISIHTTLIYLHMVPDRMAEVTSPLDKIEVSMEDGDADKANRGGGHF